VYYEKLAICILRWLAPPAFEYVFAIVGFPMFLKVREIRVLLGSFVVCWKIGFFFLCLCPDKS
jgi:hypothetical protein